MVPLKKLRNPEETKTQLHSQLGQVNVGGFDVVVKYLAFVGFV